MTENEDFNKLANTVKYFEKFNDELERFSSSLSDLTLDLWLDEDAKKLIAPEQKLTKKQRKELAIKYAKALFPKQVQALYELDLAIEGLQNILDERFDELGGMEEKLEEINRLKEEIRDELD